MLAGGLFNIHLGGGNVALLSDGEPVRLDVSEAPTFGDPQAAIAWSGGVSTTLKTDVQVKTMVGLGSARAFSSASPARLGPRAALGGQAAATGLTASAYPRLGRSHMRDVDQPCQCGAPPGATKPRPRTRGRAEEWPTAGGGGWPISVRLKRRKGADAWSGSRSLMASSVSSRTRLSRTGELTAGVAEGAVLAPVDLVAELVTCQPHGRPQALEALPRLVHRRVATCF